MYIHISIYIYTCIHMHSHRHIHIYTYRYMHVCIYIYVYMYQYGYACMYMSLHMLAFLSHRSVHLPTPILRDAAVLHAAVTHAIRLAPSIVQLRIG